MDERKNSSMFRFWPICLYWIVSFCSALATPWVMESLVNSWLVSFGILTSLIVYGHFLGLIGFAIFIGGFATRNWLIGLMLGSLFMTSLLLGLLIGQTASPVFFIQISGDSPFDLLIAALAIPLLLLVSCAPCYLMRLLRGWHLTEAANPRSGATLGIEDFLLTMASVAAILYVARGPQLYFDSRLSGYWSALLGIGVYGGVVGWIAFIPFGIAITRNQSLIRGLLWSSLGLLLAFALVALLLWLMGQNLFLGALSIGTAAFVFLIGLLALRFSGLLLKAPNSVATAPVAEVPTNAIFEDKELEPELASALQPEKGKRMRRIAAVTVFLWAFGTAMWLQLLVSQRSKRFQRDLAYAKEVISIGGTATFDEGAITGIKFSQTPSQNQWSELAHLKSLNELDLSGTEVDSEMLAAISLMPNLTQLNLARSSISDDDIEVLYQLDQILHLDLSGTSLSAKSLAQLSTQWLQPFKWTQTTPQQLTSVPIEFQFLDLSAMPVFQEDPLKILQVFPKSQQVSLGFGGYGLSDQQFEELLDHFSLTESFDVRDNNLNGSFLKNSPPRRWRRLMLDGNPISDASIINDLPPVQSLSLRRTPVTDKILATLSKNYLAELTLGESKITEKGLANCSITCGVLRIRDKDFTGECFETWQPSCSTLDLSECGVTDDTLGAILNLSPVLLNLSGTLITDDCLREFSRLHTNMIDLSNTAITFEGLKRGDLAGSAYVIVGPGQFTDEQLQELKRVINIRLGISAKHWQ